MSKLFGWMWRIGLIVVLGVGYTTAHDWWWRNAVKGAESKRVEIASGLGVRDIAEKLKQEGVITHDRSFALYVMWHGLSRNLHAGTFNLPVGEDFKTLTDLLQNAESADISITIPEGYTAVQIGDVLAEKLGIQKEAWMAVAKGSEGYLFPDTYRFSQTATAQDVYDAMRANFDARMKDAGLSPTKDQIIIASILEREVRRPEEMGNVSDIIRKRLNIGMALQMDSTVNYITGGKTASASGDDIKIDSPYNTYKYPGLPPGAIGNPGLNAIRAAVHPTANKYLYFLTDSEGRVYYAETFEQHVANRKYL